MNDLFLSFVKKINQPLYLFKYSICTLVTSPGEYQEMIQSYIRAGFTTDNCEYLYIDNSNENSYDAYEGINRFLKEAKGEFIIICHQDVLISFDNITILDKRIAEISIIDKTWAILGNAGGIENHFYKGEAINIVYPDGFNDKTGDFPKKVCSIDENFMLLKNSANLSLSADLIGFHLYGLDLCLIAELRGYSAYVIDFKLLHKSYGNPNHDFTTLLNHIKRKYIYFMRSRHIFTTITDFQLSVSVFRTFIYNIKLFKKIARKIQKIKYKVTHK